MRTFSVVSLTAGASQDALNGPFKIKPSNMSEGTI